MFLLKNKYIIISLMSLLIISGCTSKDKTKEKNINIHTSSKKSNIENANKCINELDSLKFLSRENYNNAMISLKKISEVNELYNQIEKTASPDSLNLIKMEIESKTKVECAKIRYYSILSTEKILIGINNL
ncbi:hypothetical protein ACS5F0_004069 [Providencia rettgeri]